MRQSSQAAARCYARALFEVAQAKTGAAALKDELNEAARTVKSSPELERALSHPALGVERRQRLVRALFEGRGSELLLRLLALLADKDRLALLPEVATAYARVFNEHQGVVAAQAVSAAPLDDQQRGLLQSALERATGRKVEIETKIDAAIVGGLVVTLGGRTYDGSVRAQLGQLRERLVGGVSG